MILAILAFWFGYKKARDTGRSPWLWGFICGGTYVGVQLAVGLGIGILVEIGVRLWGWSETLLSDYSILINVAAIAISFVCVYALFRFLDRVPDDEPVNLPPPPPKFDQNDQS
jgi:hypothetical protein